MGIMGYAAPLDSVSERRYQAAWGGLSDHPSGYEVLLGVQDCDYLGKSGILVSQGKTYRALVVDCNQAKHIWPYGYLGDVSQPEFGYSQGMLLLARDKKKNESLSYNRRLQ